MRSPYSPRPNAPVVPAPPPIVPGGVSPNIIVRAVPFFQRLLAGPMPYPVGAPGQRANTLAAGVQARQSGPISAGFPVGGPGNIGMTIAGFVPNRRTTVIPPPRAQNIGPSGVAMSGTASGKKCCDCKK